MTLSALLMTGLMVFMSIGSPLGKVSPSVILAGSWAFIYVSGRRWRTGFPRCWPPSAAQTGRAVFPHPAFTKTLASGMQSKELIE